MPGRIIKIDRTIRDIGVPIPPLRIGQVGNESIRLKKAVDIRLIKTNDNTPLLPCRLQMSQEQKIQDFSSIFLMAWSSMPRMASIISRRALW